MNTHAHVSFAIQVGTCKYSLSEIIYQKNKTYSGKILIINRVRHYILYYIIYSTVNILKAFVLYSVFQSFCPLYTQTNPLYIILYYIYIEKRHVTHRHERVSQNASDYRKMLQGIYIKIYIEMIWTSMAEKWKFV